MSNVSTSKGFNLRKAYGFDKNKLENGYELVLGEGASVTIRSGRHPLCRNAFMVANKKYAPELNSADDAVKEQAYVNLWADVLADTGIISWKGIVDDEGNELAFSPQTARELLVELEDFRNEVFAAAQDRSRIAYDKVDAVTKN